MMFFHTLPVELLDKILLNLSPGEIPSLLAAMDIDMTFIKRVSFLRPYCEMKLNYFFEKSLVMHSTFDLLLRRYSDKKNFYCKLFMIIADAHCTPEDNLLCSSIEIETGWVDASRHFYRIQGFIVEEMIKTFVYKVYRRNLPAVQWSHDWVYDMWPKTIFPLTFSLLVHYPLIFQNLGEEGAKMILKCYTNGITFSMIQNRILALAASGEEQTFETVFSYELFNV
jgi:hypothetical protein